MSSVDSLVRRKGDRRRSPERRASGTRDAYLGTDTVADEANATTIRQFGSGDREAASANAGRCWSSYRWLWLALGDLGAVLLAVVAGWVGSGVLRTSFDLPGFYAGSITPTLLAVLLFPAVVQLWLSFRWGHYTRFKSFWLEVGELTKMTMYSAAIGSCLLFVLRVHYSRLWIVLTLASLMILLPIIRLLVKRALAGAGGWFRPLVVIGTGDRALISAGSLCRDQGMGYRLATFIKLDSAVRQQASDGYRHGYIASFDATQQILEVVRDNPMAHVLYALDSIEDVRRYSTLLDRLTLESENVIVAPPVSGIPLSGTEIVGLSGTDTLMLRLENNLRDRPARVCKRLFDLVAASLLVVFLSPLLLWLYVRLSGDGGSPIFAHQRIGRGGKAFGCLKFRTMMVDADAVLKELLERDEGAKAEWLRDFKLRDDPRITPLGRFLRKTNLDELPQLFNVLKGEMSLVGPRPIVAAEIDRYGDKFAHYCATSPGMTGLWQTSGRNDVSYADRVELDVSYVRNWTLWQDTVMLLRTVPLFVRTQGAY